MLADANPRAGTGYKPAPLIIYPLNWRIYGYRADYTTIENNTIFECAWYSPYGNSAISLYQNWNSDSADVFRNYIVGNTCYRNESYIPFFAVGEITDGNGIIIDDCRNTQNNSTQGIYLGKTYVANNLIFDNGGRGIHVYLSDKVVIVNNTCFQNCKSPAIQDGEFTAYSADNIFIANNIAFPLSGIPPIDQGNTSDMNVEYNLWAANSNLANPAGNNSIDGNPDFVMPSIDASIADFRLLATSDAIDAGTVSNAPLTDKDGFPRSTSIDIGCYEYQVQSSIVRDFLAHLVVSVYPNPTSDILSIQTNLKESREFLMTITDAAGHSIIQSTYWSKAGSGIIALDISDYCEGIYFVNLAEKLNNFNTCFKVLKVEK